MARRVFSAAAASVFLVDHDTGELVFAAVSGEGEDKLLGTRFPPGTGIAGWVVEYCEPMLADDLGKIQEFDTSAARSTGYVPHSIMAAPLIRDGECLGVLEILDRASRSRDELQDVDLLALLSTQAAIGIEMRKQLRWTIGADPAASRNIDTNTALLERISGRLRLASESAAKTATKMLEVIDDLTYNVKSH